MGPKFARRLKRRHPGFGDTYFLGEVFVKISGKQHYLWRAVDQDGVPSLDGALLMCICKNEGMRKQLEAISHIEVPENNVIDGAHQMKYLG